MKIYLLGFMGCGKSTIGKKVAQQLEWDFVETDKLISKESNLSIKEIFKTLGENTFRQLETEILQNIANWNNNTNIIISTGGGLPCRDINLNTIKESGISIYLKLKEETLVERLKTGKDKRPLISNTPNEELESQIKQLLEQRSKYYEVANEIIVCDNMSSKDIINYIINIIKKHQDIKC